MERLQLPHTVTANTVLEFDFESNVEGEVHAVGLDTNKSLNTADAFFQLGGTQSWWAYQDFNNYATGSGVKHYVIPVGQYFTGSSSNLVFANDDDASAVAESLFSNIRIYERSLNVEVNGALQSFSWSSYSNQDVAPTAVVTENDGDVLHMTGNTWKKIDPDYTVTPNTVLEFDFASSVEGEIHAIGFDTNNQLNFGTISSSSTVRTPGGPIRSIAMGQGTM